MREISAKNRRVENIHTAEFVPFLSEGKEDGAVLQLKSAKPQALGSTFTKWAQEPRQSRISIKELRNS